MIKRGLTITNKERILQSLKHQQPDHVPYNIRFTIPAHHKMVQYYHDPAFLSKLDNSICMLDTHFSDREIMPDIWQDEFGVQWDRSIDKDIGVVCNCTITPENIADYQFPDPNHLERYQSYEQKINENSDTFIMAAIGFSLFERVWTMVGMENTLMDMLANQNYIQQLFDGVLNYNLQIITNVCRYAIDAVHFGDDWGQQTGLIMGPRLWREIIKPRIKEMYQLVKSKGKFVSIHSCGKVDELYPDLIEIGVDIFNPFQPEVIDVVDIKKRYGNKMTFWGGISTQKTLPYGTVQETRDEVRRLLDQIGSGGGYIAAPAHDIPGDAKPENIAAMIDVLENQ
jgi:uroporphyrinogen decarboxylase